MVRANIYRAFIYLENVEVSIVNIVNVFHEFQVNSRPSDRLV